MGEKKERQCRQIAVLFAGLALMFPLFHWFFLNNTWTAAVVSTIMSGLLLMAAWIAMEISQRHPADSHSITSVLVQFALTSMFVRVGAKVFASFQTNSTCVEQRQQAVLKSILAANQRCKYFKDKKLHRVESVDDFLASQPLTQYQDYSDYIDEIEAGEENILTKDAVVFLALTSGTTGKNKHIPITRDMKGPTARKVGPLMYYCMQLKAGLSLQRVMVLSYKSHVTKTKGGLQVGPVSAHMSRYVPFVVAPRESYEISEEQAALHVHAVFGFNEAEVGHMEALMSTLVYSFWKYVENNWPVICDDIEKGVLSENLSMDTDLAEALSSHLKPNPERAQALRSYFKSGFTAIASKIWPELRFVRTLTTGGFAHHAHILKNVYMKGVEMLSLAHVASEGFMGFNIDSDPGVQLYTAIADYGFLEFIPIADVSLDQPKTCLLHQLQREAEYEVVITSPMGLYRYRTGDVIKVVDFLNQTPIYSFQYRMGQLLNLYWEKTPELVLYTAVMEAVNQLCKKGKKVKLVDFTATEDVCMPIGYKQIVNKVDSKKHYVLFVELQDENGEEVVLDYEEKLLFDQRLCDISELYRMIRECGSAGTMEVLQLLPGAFLQLKAHMIDHTQNQQYKVPRVMRRHQYLRILMLLRSRKSTNAST